MTTEKFAFYICLAAKNKTRKHKIIEVFTEGYQSYKKVGHFNKIFKDFSFSFKDSLDWNT